MCPWPSMVRGLPGRAANPPSRCSSASSAGSFFYLDSYRTQLLKERFKSARAEAEIVADAVEPVASPDRRMSIARIGSEQRSRLRLYGADNASVADSFASAGPSFVSIDPETEPWYQKAARSLDRGVDLVVGAPKVDSYREPA
ncbi:hypothetical protein OY671_011278, partial [Metschnikowia pulcherrima]